MYVLIVVFVMYFKVLYRSLVYTQYFFPQQLKNLDFLRTSSVFPFLYTCTVNKQVMCDIGLFAIQW